MSSFSFSGLGSGLDTASIIEQLMALERRPQTQLRQKVASQQTMLTQFQSLNSMFLGIRTASEALNLSVNWKAAKATSSDAAVTATAGAGALPGSLSFAVKNLARAQTLSSFGTVSGLSTVVGSGSTIFGLANTIGIATMKGTGVTDGAHALTVTQASIGATVTGTPAADSITLSGTETLDVNINGVARSFTLAAGTYNQKQLAAMVSTASGGALKASVNSDKSLNLATTREGSAASLQVTGGTGLGALGLSAGATVFGTDGIITVDGVANTVTDINPSSSVPLTLNSSAGTIDVTFSGGLRTGTANVKSVNLGDGTLSSVVSAINAAGLGISAAAVQVAPNQYKLQLASTTTGSAGAITTDLSAFTGALGQMEVTQAAEDAKLTIGSGANAYDVTSSTNTVANFLPGVTLTLNSADPAKTVNVVVGGDAEGLADKVAALVASANAALAFIKSNTGYSAAAKIGGPLQGDSTTNRLQSKLFSTMTDQLASSSLGDAGALGIKSQADGTFVFDRAKFLAAYKSNPEAVASAFVEGGSTGVVTPTNPGLAEKLQSLAKQATDTVSGMITGSIKGRNTTITDLNRQITDWDARLIKKQTFLKQQFASLDTAMSRFRSQGDWLAGQIGGLQNSNR